MTSGFALKTRPCLVAALDLLGREEPSEPPIRIQHAIDVIDTNLGDWSLLKRKSKKNFDSRLIVAGNRLLYFVPIEVGGKLPFHLLLNILHLQVDFVHHGILVRGAITLGDAAGREDVALGAGLIEAERLRNDLADVPRVIVDPRLMREVERSQHLRAQHHSVADELAYIRDLLREDADGVWFIDYLGASSSELDEPSDYLEFLQDHGQLAEHRLAGTSHLNRVARSWIWLRSYHNRVIDELFDEKRLSEAERSRLRIPATSPLVYAFPPSALKP
jgi:hypothetical protein